MSLSDRKRKILKAIVDEYIENAEPVGSKVIASRSRLDISPATIRNEMSELEELGFLEQPHVSAGRIPSTAGYRLYVDELMNSYKLSVSEAEAINSALRAQMRELERTLQELGGFVSKLTNYTTYALMPSASGESIKKLDIFLTDPQTAVVVIVTDSALLRNKRIRLAFAASDEEVAFAVRILNENLTGKTLDEISLSAVRSMAHEARNLSQLIFDVCDFASEVLDSTKDADVSLGGISRILEHPEYRDPEKAQELLAYLTDKREIVRHAREHAPENGKGSGIKIYIGSENGESSLCDASVVYGTYDMGENLRGVIGIVGPRRMDYAKVAANLNYFINGFNKLLKDSFFNE